MAADIDVRSIAAFSSLPEATVAALLDSPTHELVKSLLGAIEAKAKEYEHSKSQKVKLEVELEAYVRTSESKTKVIQNSRDKALGELSKLRVDAQNAENARSRTESELEQLRQSNANETGEIGNLKSRISSLEASNRDLTSLLDTKTSAYDRLSQDLSAQHQKVIELRKHASTSEQAQQTANSAVASAKFREHSLQQELDLQKKNNEWLENERKIKSDEHTAFRKEKNARIAELARSNEQYIDEAEALRRSETTFRSRLDEQMKQHEDLLQQIEKLREKESADADSHRIELDSVNRLAQLQEASANTAKARVQELSDVIEEVKEEAADEVGRIRAEIEAEHQDREAAEQRVAELEGRIAQLEGEVEQVRAQPATPRREINGSALFTPARPGTPSGIFSPAVAGRLKGNLGNLTVSQLYGEYKSLEKELTGERRLNAELQSNLDSMLEDLENKRPEIEELREDQTRLQSEVFEMSTLVESASHDRNDAIKQARILQGQLEAISKELDESRQTLRDRNSQLRWLIMDRQARERGESLSDVTYSELEQVAKDADERDTEHLSDTQRVVNQQLVLFKSVAEMQQQNENQLVTIRRLVAELESNETRETQQQNERLRTNLESATSKMADYQAEIKNMVAQSKSFVKERDMFKNMLTRRGHLPGHVDPNEFSRSMPLPAGGSPARSIDGGSLIGGESDYAKLLKDMQAHFDNYRQETAANNEALRSQNNDMTTRNAKLQTETSKAVGQLAAATQRYEMLQANYDMLKTENNELQKRSNTASDNASKLELRVQQAAEDLIEARGLLDGLRREAANLKAEKDLWKSVEKRLIDDTESLRNERGRLDQLNSSLQNILNEREQADSETRRRLQSQVESLENELQTAKRKLNDELEESKRTSQRREYDHEQSQKRIDDLVTSLGTTREELASSKTSRDHLQARVDELSVELRSAEERLDVLSRPAEVSGQANGASEDALSREQELSVEVSELKRDLELKTTELDRANEQIEVYKSIAQSAEERLQQLTETNDQFKEETEATIAEKETKVRSLEQRIDDISSELTTTNTELTTLRDEQSESNRKLDAQKTDFESEIARLKESEEKSIEQAQFNLEASKLQAQIATDAQQNYEAELLKHAEAAKNLHTIRAEANDLRLAAVDLKTQVDTVRNDLEQKEVSWAEMKDRYEREIADLKNRRDEIVQQNTLLHGQLESLTQQITALQRDRAAFTETDSTESTDAGVKGLSDLQEVIKYLRREKEIVDVQYHLSIQEAKRLRQQLEFAQTQLDNTKLKLNQQQRADADTERNTMSHNKLMETLGELNLYRESSVTLRAEAKQATQALAAKSNKVNDLEQQIQPLQAQIAEMENLAELREGEMKLLQNDRDHWQERCQNILSKYDRVDPAELESLKSKLINLEKERDEAAAAQTNLQSQIDDQPNQIKAARESLKAALTEQFKGRSQKLSAANMQTKAELDAAKDEKVELQAELDTVKAELQALKDKTTNTAAKEASETQEKSVDSSQSSGESTLRITELETRVSELEATIAAKDQEHAASATQQEEKFKTKETQLKEVLNKRLTEVKQQATAAKETALGELRQKLEAEHQQEMESLRAQSIPVGSELAKPDQFSQTGPTEAPAETAAVAATATFEHLIESISQDQAKQLVNQNKTVQDIVRRNINKGRAELKETLRQEVAAEAANADADNSTDPADEDLQKKLVTEREAIIKQKTDEFTAAKEAMTREFEDKLEAEKQALAARKDQEFALEKLDFSKVSEAKIAEQVATAQMLTEKKSALKVNMASNKANLFSFKVELVKKAAEDTPERPVKEVWDIVKDAKPVPQQQQPKPMVPPSPSANNVIPTNPAAPTSVAAAPALATANGTVTNGTAETTDVEAKTEPADGVTADDQASTNQTNAGPGSGATAQARTSIPQARGAFRGRGGAGVAGHQSQQLGQQQSQSTRGTGIPRGRGGARGGGRGGLQTGIPSASTATRGGSVGGSPSRGALNAGAQQFIPAGNKRAREDSEGGHDGNMGKRIRGGGNASVNN